MVKVAYVISAISSDNTGMGGSYRSLMALASGMIESGSDAKIFALGDIYPISYQGSSVPVEHINFKSPFRYWKEVLAGIASYAPTHLHAFDNKSYFFARLVARKLRIPVVLTRPGGPNPTRYFPHSKDVVAFSEENSNYFRKLGKLKDSSVHLIPNRISEFDLCSVQEAALRNELKADGGDVIVLRICRISPAYEESIHQAANLTKALNKASVPARLVVVGLIQDQSAYDRVRSIDGIRTDFVTDPRYTLDAKKLIGLGDVVVGVGRGFMEAALHGKILLSPVKGEDLPALVVPSNFEQLARTNFSPRGAVPGHRAEESFRMLLDLLHDPKAASDYSTYIKSVARDRFSISRGVEKHLHVYRSRTNYTASGILDHALNFVVVARFYLPVMLGIRLK